MFKLSDFDYDLPQRQIAQYPSRRRELSRLLVLNRAEQSIGHYRFCDIIDFFQRGDLLVLNDTKVKSARLLGRRRTGGKVEVLVLKEIEDNYCQALIKPLGRLKSNEEIFFDHGFSCRLTDAKNKIVQFKGGRVSDIIRKIGLLPLPPYIRRSPGLLDEHRYQTVFARKEGAVAAPTAGLHFTEKIFSDLKKIGVDIAYLTLHVSYATFSPVRSKDLRQHHMHEEDFQIPKKTVDLVRRAKRHRRRVFAVGTTVCKALEDSFARLLPDTRDSRDISSSSSLFIYPPFNFRIIDALITNFHLPRTTLLMLVAAFAGRSFMLEGYRQAIDNGYRFYSYGDAMLVL